LGDAELISGQTVSTIMNAPVNRNTVEKQLLLAAIEELESDYILKNEACIALMISRNYHLLTQQSGEAELKLTWMQSAKYWCNNI